MLGSSQIEAEKPLRQSKIRESRPNMMTTSWCGLPVCLSGVHVLPQARPPCGRLISEDFMERSNRHGSQSLSDAPNLASDFHASSKIDIPLTQPSTTGESDVDCTLAVTMTDYSFQIEQLQAAWPRFSVAKEIADLDRRREAIKKQRLQRNAGNLMDDYRFIREINEFILASVEHNQSRLHGQSDCIQRNSCAKAA